MMRRTRYRFSRHRGSLHGFTIMELSVALAVMVILTAGIFTLASGGLELLNDVQDLQQRETRKRRFVELCRQNLESLPAGAEVSFSYEPRGGHYDTYLSVRHAPSAFGFGRGDFEVQRVVIAAEVDSSGFIRASIYYLDAEADDRYERGDMSSLDSRSLQLMRRLRQLSWNFYDSSRLEWVDVLPKGSNNPSMIALTVAGEGEPEPVRAVFWVPARQIEDPPQGAPASPNGNEGANQPPAEADGQGQPAPTEESASEAPVR